MFALPVSSMTFPETALTSRTKREYRRAAVPGSLAPTQNQPVQPGEGQDGARRVQVSSAD